MPALQATPYSCDRRTGLHPRPGYYARAPHFAYMLTSYRGALYTGSTSRLARRLEQHRSGAVPGFTRQYRTNRLVHVEVAESAEAAFARERQIKGWKRDKQVALIESVNPYWEDLSERV